MSIMTIFGLIIFILAMLGIVAFIVLLFMAQRYEWEICHRLNIASITCFAVSYAVLMPLGVALYWFGMEGML